ncbi:MAG: hypothetical protein ACI8V5_004734, partial [Limisphaerales bacterium]
MAHSSSDRSGLGLPPNESAINVFPAKVPQESLKKIRCDDAEGKFVRKIT